jgi:hypothetical protein
MSRPTSHLVLSPPLVARILAVTFLTAKVPDGAWTFRAFLDIPHQALTAHCSLCEVLLAHVGGTIFPFSENQVIEHVDADVQSHLVLIRTDQALQFSAIFF